MHTQIYANLSELPPEFRTIAESRIHATLRRWRHRVAKVRVFLEDDNGPRGGFDTSCRLVVDPQRGPSIVTRGRASDAEGALFEALQRALRRVQRREERRVSKQRSRSARRDLRKVA
jgi:ribosome-associated translation inhibitor RaiA